MYNVTVEWKNKEVSIIEGAEHVDFVRDGYANPIQPLTFLLNSNNYTLLRYINFTEVSIITIAKV